MVEFVADKYGNVEDVRGKRDHDQGQSTLYPRPPEFWNSRGAAPSSLRAWAAIILFFSLILVVGGFIDYYQGRSPFRREDPAALDKQWLLELEKKQDTVERAVERAFEKDYQRWHGAGVDLEKGVLELPPKRGSERPDFGAHE